MYSIQRAHETNKFHAAVVQRRLRNVQKSVVLGKVVVLLKKTDLLFFVILVAVAVALAVVVV